MKVVGQIQKSLKVIIAVSMIGLWGCGQKMPQYKNVSVPCCTCCDQNGENCKCCLCG